MSAIPISFVTAMAIHKEKDRQEEEQSKWKDAEVPTADQTVFVTQNTPVKYNGKMMNSIWGLYNRYASSSFQKNSEADSASVGSKSVNLVGWLGGQHPN